jgi:hypothetical protein
MSAFKTAFALASALALAACAADGGGMSSNFGFGSVATDSISPYYTPSTVTYAAQRGTIPIVIIGNPFTGPEQPVDVAIRDSLRMPGWAPNARFVPDANADAGKGHRVVMVLNPANPNLNPNALCGTDPVATVSGGPFMIRAAFCQDALPLSPAWVRRAAPSGPSDPAFTQAAAQAVNLIFPFAELQTISVQ